MVLIKEMFCSVKLVSDGFNRDLEACRPISHVSNVFISSSKTNLTYALHFLSVDIGYRDFFWVVALRCCAYIYSQRCWCDWEGFQGVLVVDVAVIPASSHIKCLINSSPANRIMRTRLCVQELPVETQFSAPISNWAPFKWQIIDWLGIWRHVWFRLRFVLLKTFVQSAFLFILSRSIILVKSTHWSSQCTYIVSLHYNVVIRAVGLTC